MAALLAGAAVALGSGVGPAAAGGITPQITTLAGGVDSGPAAGTTTSVSPSGVALPPAAGNPTVWVSDPGEWVVRQVSSSTDNEVVVDGDGDDGSAYNGLAATADAIGATTSGIAVDASGDLWVASGGNSGVQFVPASSGTYYGTAMTGGDQYTIAGTGTSPSTCTGHTDADGDGCKATQAKLSGPDGLAVDASGDLFISDTGDNLLRIVPMSSGTSAYTASSVQAGYIYALAGGGTVCASAADAYGDGCPEASSMLNKPAGVAVDSSGDLIVADTSDNLVRFIPLSSGTYFGQSMTAGDIYAVVGNGATPCTSASPCVDGTAASAYPLFAPGAVTTNANGLYLTSSYYYSGSYTFPKVLFVPYSAGTYYGRSMGADDVYTVAGTTYGYGGDGGPATSAQMRYESWVAVDSAGDLVIGDPLDARVRFVPASAGTYFGLSMQADYIYTVDGNGKTSYAGDGGPALDAQTDFLQDAITDSSEDLIISDEEDSAVRFVPTASCGAGSCPFGYSSAMTAGDIYTIVHGTGSLCAGHLDSVGDGCPATGVDSLASPRQIALDANNNLLIADQTDALSGEAAGTTGMIRVVAASTGTYYGQSMTAGDVYSIAGGGSSPTTCTGETDSYGDGCLAFGTGSNQAQAAAFNNVEWLTTDSAGDVLVDDYNEGLVRLVSASGCSAGSCPFGYSGSMTAGHIYAVAGDPGGDCLTGDFTSGSVAVGAGGGLCNPDGIAVDSRGDLVIAAENNGALAGSMDVVPGSSCSAGSCPYGYSGAMTAGHVYALTMTISLAAGVAIDANGDLTFTRGWYSNQVYLFVGTTCGTSGHPACEFGFASLTAGQTALIAGSGTNPLDGVAATTAQLNTNPFLSFDHSGDFLLIPELNFEKVRAVPASAPAAPSGLSANSGSGGVALSWSVASAPPNALSGYQLLRGSASGGESALGLPLPASPTSDTDFSAPAGAISYYTVEAIDSYGDSSPSNEASAWGPATLSLAAPSNLYWSDVLSGYDQWGSASSTPLSSCSVSGQATACSGGTAPDLEVVDTTGSGSGWALTGYLSATGLPSGAVLDVAGAGTAAGLSSAAGVTSFPFSTAAPSSTCDGGSACTPPSPATSCSHASLGVTACPVYPVSLGTATSATSQVDLYSATSGSGKGAVCFASGTASAAGCIGTTSDALFDLGVPANALAGAYSGAVITLTVSSGP